MVHVVVIGHDRVLQPSSSFLYWDTVRFWDRKTPKLLTILTPQHLMAPPSRPTGLGGEASNTSPVNSSVTPPTFQHHKMSAVNVVRSSR